MFVQNRVNPYKLCVDDDYLTLKQNIKLYQNKGYLLVMACTCNAINCVKMLLRLEDINPEHDNNKAIQIACRMGSLELVKILMVHPKTDPSRRNNECIQKASENGHVEIVKHLLKDSRVDPTVNDCYPLERAIENGHNEIVKLLVNDYRIQRALNLQSVKNWILVSSNITDDYDEEICKDIVVYISKLMIQSMLIFP
jgi:ankyrin repeat protein